MGPVEVDTQASRFPTRWRRRSRRIPLLAYPQRLVAAAAVAVLVADLLVAAAVDRLYALSYYDSSVSSTEAAPTPSRPAKGQYFRKNRVCRIYSITGFVQVILNKSIFSHSQYPKFFFPEKVFFS